MAELRLTHGKCVTCQTWQPIKRLRGPNGARVYAHGGCPGANQVPEAFVDLPGLVDELDELRAQVHTLRTNAEVHEQTSRRADRVEQQVTQLRREVNAKYDETSLGRDVKRLRGLYEEACAGRDKLAEQVVALTARMGIVEKFVAERAQIISSARQTHSDSDYDRWNGHAEARRILAQQLGLPVTWPAGDKQKDYALCRHCGEPIHKLIDRSAAQPWWTHVHQDLIACDLVIPTAGSTRAEPGGAA